MKPHKHAELIKAWANGAVIEHRCLKRPNFNHWHEFNEYWDDCGEWEYRIKPEPKPDVVKYGCLEMLQGSCAFDRTLMKHDNLKLTFDGETGELKSAEVLK